MSVATKLCPNAVQSTALGRSGHHHQHQISPYQHYFLTHDNFAGFIFVLAQAGGNLFPTVTGLIAAHAGVSVLQPILVGLFVLVCASWWLVPPVEKERES
jgi:hypothetical protein